MRTSREDFQKKNWLTDGGKERRVAIFARLSLDAIDRSLFGRLMKCIQRSCPRYISVLSTAFYRLGQLLSLLIRVKHYLY